MGNGFPLEEARGRKVLLMGGGIGIPPMLETARSISGEKQIILGYRDERFLEEEFRKEGNCVCGHRGRQRRHQGQRAGRRPGREADGGCDFRLRADAHAAGR